MKRTIKILAVAMLTMTATALQAASTCAGIPLTTPPSDFIVHRDGTVTHKKTGLMWKVCSEGQSWSVGSCTGRAGIYTWQAALQIPETLNASGGFATYTDWRLPNIKELASIAELACYGPAINGTVFPSTSNNFYWSASPDANNSSHAWGVNFYHGGDYHNYRSSTLRVRLVRSPSVLDSLTSHGGTPAKLPPSVLDSLTSHGSTPTKVSPSVIDLLTSHGSTPTKVSPSVIDSLTPHGGGTPAKVPPSVLDLLMPPVGGTPAEVPPLGSVTK